MEPSTMQSGVPKFQLLTVSPVTLSFIKKIWNPKAVAFQKGIHQVGEVQAVVHLVSLVMVQSGLEFSEPFPSTQRLRICSHYSSYHNFFLFYSLPSIIPSYGYTTMCLSTYKLMDQGSF